MAAAKKVSVDHDDYEWEDGWDDKALKAWEREQAEKQERKTKAKDARTARKESGDE